MPIGGGTLTDPNAVEQGSAAGGDLNGTYPNPTVAALAVTTTKINNGAVTAAKVAAAQQLQAPLFDSTLGADTQTIDTGANGIAQTYDGLVVCILSRTDEAAVVSSVTIRVNGDSGANYDFEQLRVTGTTVTGQQALAATSWLLNVCGGLAQAGAAGAIYLVIQSYRQTTFHKAGNASVFIPDSTAAAIMYQHNGLRWRSTVAVNQISVAAPAGKVQKIGSRLTVYGF